MFQWLTHPLLKRLIESRIKSAFKNNDDEKLVLKQWLAVARGGQFDATAFHYQFKTGQSLAEFGLTSSDRHLTDAKASVRWYQRAATRRASLNQSQSDYKNVLMVWRESKQKDPVVQLRWHQRLFAWCIRVSRIQWAFDSTDFDDKTLFAALRQHQGIEEGSRPIRHPLHLRHPQVLNQPCKYPCVKNIP